MFTHLQREREIERERKNKLTSMYLETSTEEGKATGLYAGGDRVESVPRNTVYPDGDFSWFTSPLPGKLWDMTTNYTTTVSCHIFSD
jgi:hypothetical protein